MHCIQNSILIIDTFNLRTKSIANKHECHLLHCVIVNRLKLSVLEIQYFALREAILFQGVGTHMSCHLNTSSGAHMSCHPNTSPPTPLVTQTPCRPHVLSPKHVATHTPYHPNTLSPTHPIWNFVPMHSLLFGTQIPKLATL